MNYSYSIRELDTISIDLTWKRYIYIYMKKKNILFGKSDVNRNTNAPHDPTFPKLFRLFFGSLNLFTSKVKHILDSLTLIGNRFSGVICKHFFFGFHDLYSCKKRPIFTPKRQKEIHHQNKIPMSREAPQWLSYAHQYTNIKHIHTDTLGKIHLIRQIFVSFW